MTDLNHINILTRLACPVTHFQSKEQTFQFDIQTEKFYLMVSFIIRYSLSMSCNQIQAQSSILKKAPEQPNPLAASRHSFFSLFISLGVADNSIFIASGWLSVGSSTHRKCVPKPSFTFSATRYRIPSKSNQNNNNNTCKDNNVSNCGILCEM